jgi:nucleotidyltransferase/DNA polymerase involved in DNA repair
MSDRTIFHVAIDAFVASARWPREGYGADRPASAGGRPRSPDNLRERVREVLLGFSPTVEFVSVSEAYVELTGLEKIHGPLLDAATRMRAAVAEKTGVSVSIGIGTSKLLARIASGCAGPAGILLVFPGNERPFLREMGAGLLSRAGKGSRAGKRRSRGQQAVPRLSSSEGIARVRRKFGFNALTAE